MRSTLIGFFQSNAVHQLIFYIKKCLILKCDDMYFHCRTGSTEEYLALPKSTDDKDFDESVLKSCQGRVKIPSTKTRDDANRYL